MNLQLPEIFYQDLVVPKSEVDLLYSPTFMRYIIPVDRTEMLKKLLEQQYGIVAKIMNGKFNDETFEAIKAEAKSISSLRQYVGMQKVGSVAELVKNELTDGAYRKIVLFCHHRAVVMGLKDKLTKFGSAVLFGGTPQEKKDKIIEKFQTNARLRVLICSINACGTSVNLTAASQVMFVEQTFVPADMEQAAKRCHRIGQKEPVRVRFVSVDDGVDLHVARILKRKTEQLSQLYAAGENNSLTKVTEAEEINSLV